MELDLDSFVTSTSSDEDEPNAVHRRTVDEILNDSDSSSSSSDTPLLPSNSLPRLESDPPKEAEQQPRDQSTPTPTPEALEESTISFTRRRSRELSSYASVSSLGLRNHSSSSSSRPLPSLFGSVRPNPKPGAALAAAAAASRSSPTPHAAAIKSRRASTGSLLKALQLQEPTPDPHVVEDVVSEELYQSDTPEFTSSNGKLGVEVDDREVPISGSSTSSVAEVVSEVVHSEEIQGGDDASWPVKEVETAEQSETNEDLVESSSVVSTSVVGDENVHEMDVNSVSLDDTDAIIEHLNKDFHKGELEDQKPERDEIKENTFSSGEITVMEEETKRESDIDKIVGERLGQLESSKKAEKKAEKKLRASMKPLEWAEELEKKNASSGLHWEEGAAAQPMRLEGIRRGPPAVGYLQIDLDNEITRSISSQAFRREHGSPQVLAVHMNFIAMGMSKGAVFVVPSKYSAHSADNMDAKMLMFGAHGEKTQSPVTSMCFSQQGDLLLVGYGDGHLTVWDVQKATAAKVITGEHTSPVVHTLFLGQDSQVTRQFKAVTGDSKGLVLLHNFSVVPLLNRFSIKTQCLLDGQRTGIVLSACPLLMDDSFGSGYASAQGNSTVSPSGLSSMVGGVVGGVVGGEAGWKIFSEGSSLVEEGVVIFVTNQNALVVRLSPSVEKIVYLSKPDGVREGSMPYTAWKCTTYSHGPSTDVSNRSSWLAIAWDRKVQVAELVKSELKNNHEWNLDSAAIGVAWLGDQMLVVLTLRGQLCLFSKDGTELHRTSFVVDGLAMDDIITYHTNFTNVFGNPEKAYHNSVAVRGATIYVLGPMHLIISRLLPWKERIQVLRKAGDWMGALDMAMRLYDGHAHGVIDLPRTVDAIREAIMPYLIELLLSYVDEVFSYISVAFCNQIGRVGQGGGPSFTDSSIRTEIGEQFARVGGVAVEFCVHIKRTDILFDGIFSKFVAVQHGGTFLQILEPYILRDMLGCLPPEIMQALVEHYSGKGWLQRVEQCVLHMDISSLDFNQVVRLCREHGLYGALIYLFNRGLDDFKAPLEELLVVVQNGQRTDVDAIGYRMLVYLKYCFLGLAFPPAHDEELEVVEKEKTIDVAKATPPSGRERIILDESDIVGRLPLTPGRGIIIPGEEDEGVGNVAEGSSSSGHGTLPPFRLLSVRKELLQFLLEDSKASTSEAVRSFKSSCGACPNLCYILWLDTEATLEVLRYAFSEEELKKSENPHDLTESHIKEEKENDFESLENQNMMVQSTVDTLIFVLDLESDVVRFLEMGSNIEVWPSKKDLGHVLEFISCFVACKRASVSGRVLKHILEYLTSNDVPPYGPFQKTEASVREKQVLALLKAVPEPEWDSSFVLHLCFESQFFQVCGLIHTNRGQYIAALDSYMKDLDEPIHAFAFIHKMLLKLKNTEASSFQLAVTSRIPELVKLSRECTFFLVIVHFSGESQHILSELQSHPQSLFLFLKTIIDVHLSGKLSFSAVGRDHVDIPLERMKNLSDDVRAYLERLSDFPKLLHNNAIHVTDEMAELYLELLCQYESNSVLKFLETFENYRLERCLHLCQEYGVTDAAAFLLERVGDIGSALVLVMTGLTEKLDVLVAAVENTVSERASTSFTEMEQLNDILKLNEVDSVRDVLHASIGLCQRNTKRLDLHESESLWFRLLDSFSEPLRKLYGGKEASEGRNHSKLFATSGVQEGEDSMSRWSFLKFDKCASILRRVFSQFIGEIIEGMVGYVPLPDIMAKLLSDNGKQEFGDFKFTILGMLGIYGYEKRILDTAKSLIEDDTFYTMSLLKKGTSHAYAPQGFTCCMCGFSLTKGTSTLGVRVFNCGHSTHLHCESGENEPSNRDFSAGCPICLPKKNSRARSKSILLESGLVKNSTLSSQPTHGIPNIQHLHEPDVAEKPYGLQQMSRFEILSSLQKAQRSLQIDTLPQLRLSPPAIYHEKVPKATGPSMGEPSNTPMKNEKPNKRWKLMDPKVKGSSTRFPSKSSIFGPEKNRIR